MLIRKKETSTDLAVLVCTRFTRPLLVNHASTTTDKNDVCKTFFPEAAVTKIREIGPISTVRVSPDALSWQKPAMTKLMQWLLGLSIFMAVWAALLSQRLGAAGNPRLAASAVRLHCLWGVRCFSSHLQGSHVQQL
ncbi:hypothetical protein MRX96_005093 [Rhipicephalus microplus]